jgi:hypothetical protein
VDQPADELVAEAASPFENIADLSTIMENHDEKDGEAADPSSEAMCPIPLAARSDATTVFGSNGSVIHITPVKRPSRAFLFGPSSGSVVREISFFSRYR